MTTTAETITIKTSYFETMVPKDELNKLRREINEEVKAKKKENTNQKEVNLKTSYCEIIVPKDELDKLEKEVREEMVKNKNKESRERYEKYDKDDKLNNITLYWSWRKKGDRLKKDKLKETIGTLKSTYGRMFAEYIKKSDIKWLQKKINEMIDRFGKTPGNMENIKLYMKWQGTSLDKNNHIAVDWKLWPQTLNALQHLDHNIDYDSEFSDANEVYNNLSDDEKKSFERRVFKNTQQE